MSRYTPPGWANSLYRVVGFLTEDLGCCPKQLKMAWVSNFHKVITLFLIAGMMVFFR